MELKHLALNRPLAAFDVETTGIDVRSDRIIEIAVLVARPARPAIPYNWRVNPGRPIPAVVTRIHGIRDADVANAPSFAAIAPDLVAALDGCDLTGFGIARFDLPILIAEFRRVGIPFGIEGRAVIDSLSLFHRMEPRDLSAAAKIYLGRDHNHAHSAIADAACALAVLDAQIGRHCLPRTVADLHVTVVEGDVGGVFRRAEDGSLLFAIGKYRGRPLHWVAATEPGYLTWLLGQPFLDDVHALVRAALAGRSRD